MPISKTLSKAAKAEKEKFTIPKSVQDAIPIQRIWPDGIFQVGRRFSKTFSFTDINYSIASKDDKTAMFLDYAELLNALDSGASAKITINNRKVNKAEFEKSLLLPMKEDGLDPYRKEYNEMLLSTVTGVSSSVVQDRYITITVAKRNIDEARTYFSRVGTDLITHLAQLSSIPDSPLNVQIGSEKEVEYLAEQICRLVEAAHGHTLVLFTSYALMGAVYNQVKDRLPFPLLEVWRHSSDMIHKFKHSNNAVLFAAGSCWEGVDFPGDMVSSLIIVRLPFSVPNPLSEAEREQYPSLQDYIRAVIIPDMQVKLRQGFGRAIRTETDTCVISILDHRAAPGERYHQAVLEALPNLRITRKIKEVEEFIRAKKSLDYFLS